MTGLPVAGHATARAENNSGVLSIIMDWKKLSPLAALADQAWLSLLNFAISLAFIWEASKYEYGYYLLLVAPLLLVQSIQNAIVNSPLATFLPAASESEKPAIRKTAAALHFYLAIIAAALGGAGLAAYEHWAGLEIKAVLFGGFVFAILGTLAREAQRSFAYVQGQGLRALSSDLAYGGVLLAGLAWALHSDQLTAGVVLILTGLAGVIPLLLKLSTYQNLRLHPEPLRQFWSCGRWALPSVLITWINLSAYPYFAEHALGLAAVADLGVARLFLMPVGLALTAWSNWYRPRISAWLITGDVRPVKRLTLTSLLVGWSGLATLAVAIVTAYPFIETALGMQYKGLQPLILMWILYFALSLARNIFMATLMTDAQGYKILHHIAWFALVLSLPGFILLSGYGAIWVIGVLCAVEMAQLALVVAVARGYWKRAVSGR